MGRTICRGRIAPGIPFPGIIFPGIIALGLAGSLALGGYGCEGSESREKADATVETVVGKEQTDQFKEVKKELQAIEAQQAERYKALEEK
jgi:hypothetical protein